jgi:hypothetical protein
MNQKGTQLSMFMPAKQIVESHVLGDFADQSPAGKAKGLAYKQAENTGPNGADYSGGITHPIQINHRESMAGQFEGTERAVYDGHHRLAHAMNTNPHMEIPLQHTDMTNPSTIAQHRIRQESSDRMKRAMDSVPKGAY